MRKNMYSTGDKYAKQRVNFDDHLGTKERKKIIFKEIYIIYINHYYVSLTIIMGRIDLSKVPEDRVLSIAEEHEIDLSRCRTLDQKRRKIREELEENTLLDLTSDYIYGGKTSIVWYKYTPEENTEIPINRENITEILTYLCQNENPFEIERHPELSKTPQIINARILDDSKALVLFATRGNLKEIFHGYEPVTYIPTEWTYGLIRFDDNVLEFRSNFGLAKTTANNLLLQLAQDSRFVHSFRFLNLTEDKLIELKNELDATMRSYKGIDDTGVYNWREYAVRPDEDIWIKPQFQQDKTGLITPESRLMFPSRNDPEYKVQIRANTRVGGISFINFYVSEEDIGFVYDALKRINVIR